jgi:stage II sporulation protein D
MRKVRALGAVCLGSALAFSGLTVTPAVADTTYRVPDDGRITLRGHGYGHGNGMSQYGAEGAARAGKHYRRIVAKYYPGTSLGTMRGRIRVLITADTTSDVKVSPARGLSVRDLADGRSWQLPTRSGIDRWRLLSTGRVQFYNGNRWRGWAVPHRTALRGQGEFFARQTLTLWVPSGGGEVARHYRGALRSAYGDTVNVLRMDKYVRGVVPAEMPASWSLEALKAQAVAARTYATRLREANPHRYYHTCDTTSCQVYGGADREYASTNQAVRETAREILRYGGEPALTQFSASSGGYTGDGGLPYLRPQPDPWDGWSGNSVHEWKTTIDTARLEAKYQSLGRLRAVRIFDRNGYGDWGGRVQAMRLIGSRNTVTISGDDLRWAYGLRSSWFTIVR